MRSYAILRSTVSSRTVEPFGFSRSSLGTRAFGPMEPKIEKEDLKAGEVVEAARDPGVVAIAPVMPTALIRPFEASADATADRAWGLEAVGATSSPFTGDGVTVAVLDTGIDKSHPAFTGVEIVEQDFSGSNNGDRQGHGTHCAGTIFGRDVDGIRIGVAPGVRRALIGKVLSDDGSGDSDMIFRGIQWAVQEGAQVVSMSLGFDFPGYVAALVGDGWPVELATSAGLEAYRGNLRMLDALMDMVQANVAFSEGTVIVAASGNESRRRQNFEIATSLPAAAQGIVSVGALENTDGGLAVADFSNTFPQVSAPGVDIVSAKVGGGLRLLSGTSMACPHVAGVAALWWEAQRMSPVREMATVIVAKLLATAGTDGFAENVDAADRGSGIVTAPAAGV